MPRRSSIFALPAEIRDELNARLVGNGFSDYEGLAAWLNEQGYAISKSSLHRHGMGLQEDFELAMSDVQKTSALARAWTQSDEDEKGDLLDATARIAQEHLLRISIALRKVESEPAVAAKHMSQVTRALADLGRMSIGQKRWAHEVRGRAQSAADAAAKIAKKGGLSSDSVNEIRRQILGIAA